LVIEMIVDGGMDRGELLKTSHSPEAEHRPLSSSEREVRVFCSVIEMATDLLAVNVSDVFHGCPIRSQSIGDNHFRAAISLHGFS